MKTGKLLPMIWQGDVAAADADSDLMRAFTALVPVCMVPVLADRGVAQPMVLSDDAELSPALSIGDVLAEELSLDVPYGSLVVVWPRRGPGTRFSRDLGHAVGESLLIAQSRGRLPAESETDTLFMLALSAAQTVRTRQMRALGVDARPFCLGLADSLGTYWRGTGRARRETGSIFSRPDFLWQPQLAGYLRELDPCFSAPNPMSVPVDLMSMSGGPLSVSHWIACLETAVHDAVETPVSGLARRPSYPETHRRFNLH